MKDIRQRMIEDMKLRGLTPGTQATYLEAVKVLARHYNRGLDEITQEQVKDFLLYLIESKGYAKSTYKVYLYAIKFLYEKTLGRQWRFLPLARVGSERKLPIILSRDEVWSLLDLVRRDKPRMSLTLIASLAEDPLLRYCPRRIIMASVQ
jgi:site-specific recombinase XerD